MAGNAVRVTDFSPYAVYTWYVHVHVLYHTIDTVLIQIERRKKKNFYFEKCTFLVKIINLTLMRIQKMLNYNHTCTFRYSNMVSTIVNYEILYIYNNDA